MTVAAPALPDQPSKPYSFRLVIERDAAGDVRFGFNANLDLSDCEGLADYLEDLAARIRLTPRPSIAGESA